MTTVIRIGNRVKMRRCGPYPKDDPGTAFANYCIDQWLFDGGTVLALVDIDGQPYATVDSGRGTQMNIHIRDLKREPKHDKIKHPEKWERK